MGSGLDFEKEVRSQYNKEYKVKLEPKKVEISGKKRQFDLWNQDVKIIGDVKNYSNTRTGNVPSAKRSIANECVWLLQRFDMERKTLFGEKDWRKILIIGEDMAMVNRYVRDYSPWLDDVEILYFDRKLGFRVARDSRGIQHELR
ncbi:MAG: hypothetical protein M1587_02170 [Thaumarchaeota archaeon]|nr:hypothetical protein [Nitrososphaerota archaeon]